MYSKQNTILGPDEIPENTKERDQQNKKNNSTNMMKMMTMFSRKFIISSSHCTQRRDRIIESQDFRTGRDLGYHLDQFSYFTRKNLD